jgi:hypothetical protein
MRVASMTKSDPRSVTATSLLGQRPLCGTRKLA